MTIYVVTDRATGAEVYRYDAPQAIEWHGMEFATHDHTEAVVEPEVIQAAGPRRLTKLQFIGRLGDDFDTLLGVSKTNLEVEKFVRMLDWSTPDPDGTSVDLDDARVIEALTKFEQAGLLTHTTANGIRGLE